MPKVVLSRRDRPVETVTPARIRTVEPGSPAARAGVREGWELLRVNGAVIPDVLAYRRELERGDATLEVRAPGGSTSTFSVSWEDPGLDFDEVVFDGIRLCANKCDFCYIHQMPKGMRKSLYVMDDDFRTSFLYGSFVTLTNLSDDDIARILDEHLSPLYVSVHSADDELRADLLKIWPHKAPGGSASRIRELMARLEPIDLYTQMVLVPGRNDGAALSDTLAYLASRPNVQAAAAVPVGLTEHRGHLPAIEPYSAEQARDVLRRLHAFQRRMLAERGTRFAFASDEFYLLAGEALPPEEAYEGYPMLENGIGMVRDFLSRPLPPLPERLETPRRVLVITGRLFAPTLREALAPLARVGGLELEVRALTNRTFGAVTTVAGLLTGRDVLLGVEPGEADLVLLSPNMLKYGSETLLDDRTLDDLRRELRTDVAVGGTTLGELADAVLRDGAERVDPSFGFSTHAIKESARQH